MAPPTVPVQLLREQVDADYARTVDELKAMVAVPGIAWPEFDPADLARSAGLVAALAESAGFPHVQILSSEGPDGAPGAPAVVARSLPKPGRPTVLLYAHHDVQPPGDPALWTSGPFAPEVRDGRLWGRGAADDKSGVATHLAAFRSLKEVLGDDLGLGLTLFVEGEEESGSVSLESFLAQHGELLESDVVVVADSGVWRVGVPALTTSLRGLVDGTIELRALSHGLHSGTYGGPVLDAVTLLARLLATMHDATGAVAVEGLVEADGSDWDVDEAAFRSDAAVPPGVRLAGTGTITSRLWTKPALAIVGLDAPAVATASNTLVPRATAKFSLRIAPGDHPENAMDAIRRHVAAHAPAGAEVTVRPGRASLPFAADLSSPAVGDALWSMEEAWQVPPVQTGVGGSIPIVSALARRFPAAQILVTGAEDPDSRAHGEDESVHLGELRHSILAETLLLARLNAR
ncbi:M20/M25/M40 family metallo-hydrolase [Sinomonas susongensis]|uniref:M20/M25/M40 family metallo-hydrolase n=1 Tax=Sinomonas susongensis TaxID=1324851 RepID=UPI001107EC49|nr:M20/M25/M40 family metallo-hydrolase [Sinomonas susongensis]